MGPEAVPVIFGGGQQVEAHEGRVASREALEWTRKSKQCYLEAELGRLDSELARRGGDCG